jgi:hypothetical protein
MIHNVTFQSIEDGSDYKPVSPGLTYKDAVHILQSE